MNADLFEQPGELFGAVMPHGQDTRSLDEIKNSISDGKLGKSGMSIDDHVNRKPREKQTNHKPRARAYFEKQGYIYCPCEYRDTHYAGHGDIQLGKKHDLFGIFDSLALPKLHRIPLTTDVSQLGMIGVQICSTGDARNHIRKMASSEVDTKCGTQRVVSLRAWLAAGNHALVLEFQRRPKVGNQEWFPKEWWITEDVILDVERRRRK